MYKVQRTTAYAATTLTVSTVFHSKPRCNANMATFETLLVQKHFVGRVVCNLMCTYTVVTHPCDIPPLTQAHPMMLCIYTSN